MIAGGSSEISHDCVWWEIQILIAMLSAGRDFDDPISSQLTVPVVFLHFGQATKRRRRRGLSSFPLYRSACQLPILWVESMQKKINLREIKYRHYAIILYLIWTGYWFFFARNQTNLDNLKLNQMIKNFGLKYLIKS